jgi:hypothetical protein
VPAYEQKTQTGSGNALLWAIMEAREAISGQIEEFRTLLMSRDAAVEVEAAPPAAPGLVTVAVSEPPAVVEPRPRRAPSPPEPRATTAPVEGLAGGPPSPGDEPPAPAPARSEDARQRLDALARLLDKRARQSSGDAPSRSGIA